MPVRIKYIIKLQRPRDLIFLPDAPCLQTEVCMWSRRDSAFPLPQQQSTATIGSTCTGHVQNSLPEMLLFSFFSLRAESDHMHTLFFGRLSSTSLTSVFGLMALFPEINSKQWRILRKRIKKTELDREFTIYVDILFPESTLFQILLWRNFFK